MNFVTWGGISLILCTGTKPTYLCWGGILGIVFLFFFLFHSNCKFKEVKKCIKGNLLLLFSGIIFIIGVHYRTYLLTGYPIYPAGIDIGSKLGFSSNNYMLSPGTPLVFLNDLSLKNIIMRLYEFMFDPQNLPHVIMLWTSNILILAIIIYILFRAKKKTQTFDIMLFVSNALCMLYLMARMYMPDGNYFILPIIILTMLLLKNSSLILSMKENIFVNFIIVLFVIFQLPIMFVSHPSWMYGTRAFKPELIVDNFETSYTNASILSDNGVYEIANHVKNYLSTERVICSAGNAQVMFRLPCSLQTFDEMLQSTLCNQNNISSYDTFRDYLDDINIKALIVFKDDTSLFADYVQQYLLERGCNYVIDDQKAICYEL